MSKWALRGSVLAALGVLSCEGDANSPKVACGDLAAAICARSRDCDALSFMATYRNLDDCVDLNTRSCALSVEAPDARITAAELRTCGREITRADCAESQAEVCSLSAGRRKPGAACVAGSQCESLACGFSREESWCGVCSNRSAAGGVCVTSGECRDGLRCEGGRCQLQMRIGAPCGANFNCTGELVCRNGICMAPTTRPSEPYDLGGEGEACGQGPPGTRAVVCRGGLYCGSGRCAPERPEGAACVTGAECSLLATCLEGICQLADAAKCPASGVTP